MYYIIVDGRCDREDVFILVEKKRISYELARLIHKLRLKNEFDLRIKGNWIFERCKATASGKASLEY